jgi:putative FmdB family regulatory protein
MPIYEYKCNNCNKKFEYFHKSIKSEEHVICPQCNSSEIKKVFSKFAASVSESNSYNSYQPSCDSSSSGCCSGGMCNLN